MKQTGQKSNDGQRLSFMGMTKRLSFPEDTYLIDDARDLIYIPIPKVACTSLKIWFLLSSPDIDIQPGPASWKVNAWLGKEGRRYLLQDLAPLKDNGKFIFAFVRNPWSRLVSCYLNRIVGQGIEYRNIMKKLSKGSWYRLDKRLRYYARKRIHGVGWPEDAEPTFLEFVMREVTGMPVMEMDPHWRPQVTFLGRHQPHFIGRFERLAEDLKQLGNQFGISTDLNECNRSQYSELEHKACYADCSQAELRAMPAMPSYRQFYTPELIDTVASVYAKDIDRFGYDF